MKLLVYSVLLDHFFRIILLVDEEDSHNSHYRLHRIIKGLGTLFASLSQ